MPRIKNTKKRKSLELLELSQMHDPGELSTSGLISPEQKEQESSSSAALFPTAKKSATSDDCVITETLPKTKVKVEVIDLTDDTLPIVPTLCSSVRLPLVSNNIQIKSEVIFHASAENNSDVIFKNSRSAVSENEISTTHNVRIKSEPDIESEVYDQVPVFAENPTEASVNHLFSDVPIKVEPNEPVSENFTSVIDDVKRTDINSVDRPVKRKKIETKVNCEDRDLELREPDTFPCKFLKYLNCYPKYDGEEIDHCLSVLNDLMKDKDENIGIEPEVISVSTDSEDTIELCSAEQREEIPILQISEKHSPNLKVDGTVHKISSKDLVRFQQNVITLDSDSDSSQLEMTIIERQGPNSSNSDCIGDKRRQNISTNTHLGSPSKMSELSQVNDSDPNTNYFNSPIDTESKFQDVCSFTISLSSLDGNKRSETSDGASTLPMDAKKIPNEDFFNKDFLRQILGNAKQREMFADITDISSSLNPSFDTVDKQNIIVDENGFQNLRQKNSPENKRIESTNFTSDEDNSEFTLKKYQNLSESLPLPSENVLNPTKEVFFNPPAAKCDGFETPPKKMKISQDTSLSEGSMVKILSFEEYKKMVSCLMAGKHQSDIRHNQSNIVIDKNMLQNKSQINLPTNKLAETINSVSDENEKSSAHNTIKCQNLSKSFPVPCEKDFKTQDVSFSPPSTYCETSEIPAKRIKMSESSISKDSSDRKLSVEEYKKRVTALMTRQHSQPDCNLNNHLPSDIPSNFSDCSPGSSNVDRNMFLPPGNRPNRSLPTCSDTSLGNPGNLHMLNASYSQDPRLARNYAPTLHQKEMGSFNMSQAYSSPSFPVATRSFINPHLEHAPSGSGTYAMLNSSGMQLPAETFSPALNAAKNQQIKQWLSEMKRYLPSDAQQPNLEKNSPVLPPSPASEISSFSMTQYNPHQSIQSMESIQPFISPQYVPGNAPSLSPHRHHLSSQEIHPHMYWHPPLAHNRDFSQNVCHEFILSPQIPIINLCPSLPLSSPIGEQTQSSTSNRSPSYFPHNHEALEATRNRTIPNQSSFESLLPKQLREDIGKSIFHTNDVYLIIIEKNIDWIHRIDKEISVPKISIFGREFLTVRGHYESHLMYYNTYFPLMLLECFNKISTTLKEAKEKTGRIICKVMKSERKQSYVNFKCESFIPLSDAENIPKEGHIVLLKFATVPRGSVRMLGYVCSTTTRAYSHKHDHYHEILKYVNAKKNAELMKAKITFHTVFDILDINLELPIYILKLISIKKILVLNEALKELPRSPLCDAVLRPRHIYIKSVVLPCRKDSNAMNAIIQGIVHCLNRSARHLTLIESPPSADSFLAILQIVDEMRKPNLDGKILVCVRRELLSQMGMNLIGTSNNLIIINRKRETLHETLQNRVLDVMASRLFKAQGISFDAAKSKVLQEADVLLAVTETCFYENVKCMAKDIAYCIIHDAHSFTEPESVLPLLYGIRHLLLFGEPGESCPVSSKCAASLGYNKSLFHRVYDFR
ncbi:hypothetical protein AVEN_235547-1 [Araneus ventricosus]|uniref:Uncharacterized protein n=1 Tax=Araneus ventricosus TaxID=182803 RepID=A0A4Y2LC92_ARAVE|nr:hypothetical protein AVEN_235547-1 [Araneus ventricosus]